MKNNTDIIGVFDAAVKLANEINAQNGMIKNPAIIPSIRGSTLIIPNVPSLISVTNFPGLPNSAAASVQSSARPVVHASTTASPVRTLSPLSFANSVSIPVIDEAEPEADDNEL